MGNTLRGKIDLFEAEGGEAPKTTRKRGAKAPRGGAAASTAVQGRETVSVDPEVVEATYRACFEEAEELKGKLPLPVGTAEDPMHPVVSLNLITPEIAADLLRRRPRDRKIQRTVVNHLVQEMHEGRFRFNGWPILFSRNGELMDGVQRLAAGVSAGYGFYSLVVQNVDPTVQPTVDQQRRRSYAQRLQALSPEYGKHASVLQSMMMKLIRYDADALGKGTVSISWGQMDRTLFANPELLDAAKQSLDSPATVLPVALRAPLCFMGIQVDAVALRRFLDAVANPERYERTEPGVVIRNRLDVEKGRPGRLPAAEIMAVCIKALAATMAGERHNSYKWRSDKEAFPRLPGYQGLKGLSDESVIVDRSSVSRLPVRQDGVMMATGAEEIEGVDFDVQLVTPEMAERFLHSNPSNRRIVHTHVDTLVRDMRAGRWMQNFQPICLSRDAHMLNGQHRALAVVRSGEAQEFLIVRGLDEAAFGSYDRHAKKAPQVADLVDVPGDRNLIQAAAHIYWERHMKPDEGGKVVKPSALEIRNVIQEHPLLAQQRLYARRMSALGRASALMYAAYRVRVDSETYGSEHGDAFLHGLETAENLETGSPVAATLRKLQASMGRRNTANPNSRRAVSGAETIEIILSGWEQYKVFRGLVESKGRRAGGKARDKAAPRAPSRRRGSAS